MELNSYQTLVVSTRDHSSGFTQPILRLNHGAGALANLLAEWYQHGQGEMEQKNLLPLLAEGLRALATIAEEAGLPLEKVAEISLRKPREICEQDEEATKW